MAQLISGLPTTPVDALEQRQKGAYVLSRVLDGWRNFFSSVFTICNAVSQSGTTAERPTENLWLGRMYFDTTLGIPIWVQSFAAGVAVWVDATGAPA